MKKLCNIVEKIVMALGLAALASFILCTIYQVVARTLGINASFTEEIANYSFAWSTFLGGAIMIRHNEHFAFTAFSAKLKGKAFIINESIILLLLLAFSLMVALHGSQLTMKFWPWKFSSISKLSLGWAWVCVPISGYACVLFIIENIVNFIKNPSSRMIVDEIEELTKEGVK